MPKAARQNGRQSRGTPPKSHRSHTEIQDLRVSVYRVPTDAPESDGTFAWDATILVLVQVTAGDHAGLGYTYADESAAELIRKKLSQEVLHSDPMDVPATWAKMVHAVRNLGRPGICSMAIAAVDVALWDLKARMLNLPLVSLLGAARMGVPIYGSGGFTSYSIAQLQSQLSGWVEKGIPRVKMKIGRKAGEDMDRVRAARTAIGDKPELFVDANGAYDRKFALMQSGAFAAECGVTWFEEPVSSDDLEGLHLLRNRAPLEIAAGEYGYDLPYFRRMLEAQSVDVLQADATRCAGITAFLRVAALCEAFAVPLSAHTAPALHLHACAAAPRLRHLEYFHDHARIEHMFFDGASDPVDGVLYPDLSRPGMGLELKANDAQRYQL